MFLSLLFYFFFLSEFVSANVCSVALNPTTANLQATHSTTFSVSLHCPSASTNAFNCTSVSSDPSLLSVSSKSFSLKGSSSKKLTLKSLSPVLSAKTAEVAVTCEQLLPEKVVVHIVPLEYKLTLKNFQSSLKLGQDLVLDFRLSNPAPEALEIRTTVTPSAHARPETFVAKLARKGTSVKLSLPYKKTALLQTRQTLSLAIQLSGPAAALVVFAASSYSRVAIGDPDLSSFSAGNSATKKLQALRIGVETAVTFDAKKLPLTTELAVVVSPSNCVVVPEVVVLKAYAGSLSLKLKPVGAACEENQTLKLALEPTKEFADFFVQRTFDFSIRLAEAPKIEFALKLSGVSGNAFPNRKQLVAQIGLSRRLQKGVDKALGNRASVSLHITVEVPEGSSVRAEVKPKTVTMPLESPSGWFSFGRSYKFSVRAEGKAGETFSLVFSTDPVYEKFVLPTKTTFRLVAAPKSPVVVSCPDKAVIGESFYCLVGISQCPEGDNQKGNLTVAAKADNNLAGGGQVTFRENDGSLKRKVDGCGLFFGKSKKIGFTPSVAGNAKISFDIDGESKEQYSAPASENVAVLDKDALRLALGLEKGLANTVPYQKGKFGLVLKPSRAVGNRDLVVRVFLVVEGELDNLLSLDSDLVTFEKDSTAAQKVVVTINGECLATATCESVEFTVKLRTEDGADNEHVVLPSDLRMVLQADTKEPSDPDEQDDEKDSEEEEEEKNEFVKVVPQKKTGQPKSYTETVGDFLKDDSHKLLVVVLVLVVLYFYYTRTRQKPVPAMLPTSSHYRPYYF